MGLAQSMDYVTLGHSGLRVARLCLGTMTFGQQWGWGSDDDVSAAVLDRYLEVGGNFLDTANIYTKGYSEAFIGDYLTRRKSTPSNSLRDRLVIATKFMGSMYRNDPNGGGAGAKSLIAACEQSLRRLKTDYIDLYWAHFWDKFTPIEEMLRAMEDLRRAGKVRYFGLSDHPAWVCADAQHLLKQMNAAPLIGLQIEYSLAQRTVEAELLPMARHFGLGVTPWSPLRGGVLSGKFTRTSRPSDPTRVLVNSPHLNEKNYAIIDELLRISSELSEELGGSISPAQVALAWLLQQPGVSSIIIGARTLAQLEDNIGCLSVTLRAADLETLNKVSAVSHPFPHDFLQGAQNIIRGGTTINGTASTVWDLSPASNDERL
jgi:aryl-alcohol dehydrogenase-like predicted oxidoreductase